MNQLSQYNFSNIMLLVVILGIILIVYQWARDTKKCSFPKPIYRYLPRDFNLDSSLPDGISYKFKTMFEEPTPYVVQLGNRNTRKLN